MAAGYMLRQLDGPQHVRARPCVIIDGMRGATPTVTLMAAAIHMAVALAAAVAAAAAVVAAMDSYSRRATVF